jgi:hypothetical protein
MAKEHAQRCWVGVDVGKSAIDVATGFRGPTDRIERSKVALERWAQTLGAGTRVVIEATGGYERAIAEALREQGIEVCIVNPRQVRDGSPRCTDPGSFRGGPGAASNASQGSRGGGAASLARS